MQIKLLPWLVAMAVAVVGAPSLAYADVASPQSEACAGKKEGESCGSGGKCENRKSCRGQEDGGESCSDELTCAGEGALSGCSQSPSTQVGPWAVAFGVALAVSMVRRKRQR
jgi:hypothetical protein